ncbi:MAG: UDP-3-O-(3-hydroxymyristoyl)glucosamine N-acyltransferase [Deltaproteobacteria bacterium]|nr:UDP-3-O-(3-hydroxymyristoyl)glucosamine N-acyltransferase [Deltaproteobacteria bacterium]
MSSSFRLADLATALDAQLIGDGDLQVHRVEEPADASQGALTFLSNPRRSSEIFSTGASVFLTDMDFAAEHAHEMPCAVLACENRFLAFAHALQLIYAETPKAAIVDDKAVIHEEATLGADVSIGPFSVVGKAVIGDGARLAAHVFVDDDVVIGARCHLQPGVVLLKGTRLGDDVFINPGAVVGGEGFGFAPDGESNEKVLQIGGVQIANRVDIGANACVDRGAIADTFIGEGVKLDNLVQVAHGVKVGENAVLIAQVGIGGHTEIGARALLAGQVGVVHNVVIGEDARIGAQGGVTRDVPMNAAWSGYPAYDHMQWLKTSVHNRHLDDTLRKLKKADRKQREKISIMEKDLAFLKAELLRRVPVAQNVLGDAEE